MDFNLGTINPEVNILSIGTRPPYRKITVYPLSIRDQLKLGDLVASYFASAYKDGEDKTEVQLAGLVMDLIKDKIPEILSYAVTKEDMGEDIFAELSNKQVVDIVEIIYTVNFGSPAKKVMDLFAKIKGQFLSKRSSSMSSDDTQDMDLEKSSDSAL